MVVVNVYQDIHVHMIQNKTYGIVKKIHPIQLQNQLLNQLEIQLQLVKKIVVHVQIYLIKLVTVVKIQIVMIANNGVDVRNVQMDIGHISMHLDVRIAQISIIV